MSKKEKALASMQRYLKRKHNINLSKTNIENLMRDQGQAKFFSGFWIGKISQGVRSKEVKDALRLVFANKQVPKGKTQTISDRRWVTIARRFHDAWLNRVGACSVASDFTSQKNKEWHAQAWVEFDPLEENKRRLEAKRASRKLTNFENCIRDAFAGDEYVKTLWFRVTLVENWDKYETAIFAGDSDGGGGGGLGNPDEGGGKKKPRSPRKTESGGSMGMVSEGDVIGFFVEKTGYHYSSWYRLDNLTLAFLTIQRIRENLIKKKIRSRFSRVIVSAYWSYQGNKPLYRGKQKLFE